MVTSTALTLREERVLRELELRLIRAREEPDDFVLHLRVKIVHGLPLRMAWGAQADEKLLSERYS